MPEEQKSDVRRLVESLSQDATEYFERVNDEIAPKEDSPWEVSHWTKLREPDYFWRQVPESLASVAGSLSDRLVRNTAQVAAAMRSAPLVGAEDAADLRQATKTMRAALYLRRYRFHDVEVINDEDRILGVRPASQSVDEGLPPLEADSLFRDQAARIVQLLKLVEASAELVPPGQDSASPSTSAYRPGTAFIMMWMDPNQASLVDVADAIKETFRQFGVNAVRADDIEHEGQITQRVLNEIRTAEFLFADLTGTRPNVYYEVGFAHALGRRVLLYRQAGTGLHFDLAGYNCPEYKNLRDLRDKLTKRLESITNRQAQASDGNA